MYPPSRLDTRFLVGGKNEVILVDWRALPRAGVQIQHSSGFKGEVGIAGENPGPVLPGFQRVSPEPSAHGGCRDLLDGPPQAGLFGQLWATPAGQWYSSVGGQPPIVERCWHWTRRPRRRAQYAPAPPVDKPPSHGAIKSPTHPAAQRSDSLHTGCASARYRVPRWPRNGTPKLCPTQQGVDISDTTIRDNKRHDYRTRLNKKLTQATYPSPSPGTLAPNRRHPYPPSRRIRLRGRRAHDGTTLPLFRLRYNGSATTWGFAIYRASHEDYEPSFLPTGYPVGTPQQALDCACGLYLTDATAWQPPKNERIHPLVDRRG